MKLAQYLKQHNLQHRGRYAGYNVPQDEVERIAENRIKDIWNGKIKKII